MAPDRRADRQRAVLKAAHALGIEALLVGHLPNIRYLTGFTGSAGLLLVTERGTALLTDARYATQAVAEAGDTARVEIHETDLWACLAERLREWAPRTVGYERDRITVRNAGRLCEAFAGRLVPAPGLVEEQRVTKDPGEQQWIREAVRVAEGALEAVLPAIRAGQTEAAVAGRLEAALRERGSEAHPFPVIVASGPRSALPHAGTTTRTIGANELLLLDFGAQVGGYCADLTRTVVVGRADARQREVWEAVRSAQAAALAGLRPGLTGAQADAVARASLARAGFGEAFRHSLGHGLGLEVHENPRLGRTARETLPAGAVVTVEPGVYLEGWGGVRLEDDAVVTPEGAHSLSTPVSGLVELG